MTKINKEEYKFLKSLDDKWKWIARNYNGALITYTDKPMKNPNLYWDSFGERMEDRLFQFIQWGDEEPYEIAELIEEYEHKEFYDYVGWKYAESEEPEVNKDIQWLKREIHKELEDWHGVEGGIDEDGINEIMLLINQFEESKVKQLYEKISELESYNDELIRDNNQLRNEIDNQEVLSSDWISKNVEYAYFDMLDGSGRLSSATAIIKPEKLQNLLVPKQEDMFNGEKPDEGEVYFAIGLGGAVEINVARSIDEAIEILTKHEASYNVSKKPVIPKFVAEVIVRHKELGYDVYDSIDLIIETNGGGLPSLSDWVAINIDKYARAWLNGYMVAEEQKFYLKIGNLYLAEPLGDMTSDIVRMTRDKGVAYQFTDEKSIATHLDKFEGIEAVKAEELEE